MFKTFVTIANLVSEEPTLQNYLENGDVDLENILSIANEHVVNDLTNRNIQLKKICTSLALIKDTVTQDKIERKRFVIEVSEITNDCVVTLKGRNDTTSNYVTIFNDIILSGIGEINKLITNPYNYYYMELSNVTGLTYSAYMIENAFDLPLSRYALYLAYKRLNLLSGDVYNNKADMYKEEYRMLMDNLVFSYNNNLNDDVTVNELKRDKIKFGR
jgi:hypothetical protein